MNLTGRRILITGASRGIGAAVARLFASRGAAVALVARDGERLAAIATELGGSAYPTDLADPAALDGLVARIEADGAPIDVLVNNAGMEVTKPLWEQSAAEVAAILQLNLATAVELSRQAVVAMRERGCGHIVNVSSMAGCVPITGFTTYGASKAGLTHFSACLAVDLRGTAIRTTTVEIGPVETDLLVGVKSYEPTRRSYGRLYRSGMLCDISTEPVARAIVAAVEHDRAHVRLPRRAALSALIPEIPRAICRALTAGIRAQ